MNKTKINLKIIFNLPRRRDKESVEPQLTSKTNIYMNDQKKANKRKAEGAPVILLYAAKELECSRNNCVKHFR